MRAASSRFLARWSHQFLQCARHPKGPGSRTCRSEPLNHARYWPKVLPSCAVVIYSQFPAFRTLLSASLTWHKAKRRWHNRPKWAMSVREAEDKWSDCICRLANPRLKVGGFGTIALSGCVDDSNWPAVSISFLSFPKSVRCAGGS